MYTAINVLCYFMQIRFIAVDLILDCQKKTQPFTEKELELMKYFIIYNMKNEKASVKQNNLSFVKKVCIYKNNYECTHISILFFA